MPGHCSFHDSWVFSVFPLPSPRCCEEEAEHLGMRTPRGKAVPGMCWTWPTDSGSRSDINSQKQQLMQRPHQGGNGQELMRVSMRSHWKKSREQKTMGERENPRASQGTCMQCAQSEPLHYAGQFQAHHEQGQKESETTFPHLSNSKVSPSLLTPSLSQFFFLMIMLENLVLQVANLKSTNWQS